MNTPQPITTPAVPIIEVRFEQGYAGNLDHITHVKLIDGRVLTSEDAMSNVNQGIETYTAKNLNLADSTSWTSSPLETFIENLLELPTF